MDALKFAFEILIVGALALPWLALLIRIFSPPEVQAASEHPNGYLGPFLSLVPKGDRGTVGLVLIVAVGYLLGSAVSRISRDLFNDEIFPLEDNIRAQVYYNEYCQADVMNDRYLPYTIKPHPQLKDSNEMCNYAANYGLHKPLPPLPLKTPATSAEAPVKLPTFTELAGEMFRLQEGQLLLSGGDKVERLKGFYDQLEVLRGGAVNGFVVLALCGFGCLGSLRAGLSRHRFWRLLVLLPACVFIVGGFGWMLHHWSAPEIYTRYSDPPLVELGLFLLGLVGLCATLKAKAGSVRSQLYTGAVAAVLTVITFGGWWWTEVMYDLHVIHAIPGLQEPAISAPKPTVVAPAEAAHE
jgi:hypothetical protein